MLSDPVPVPGILSQAAGALAELLEVRENPSGIVAEEEFSLLAESMI